MRIKLVLPDGRPSNNQHNTVFQGTVFVVIALAPHNLTNNSWRGFQFLKITFDELEQVDLQEICELLKLNDNA